MKSKPIILIVDDETVNIDLIAPLLMDTYQIKVATNGEDALKIANNSNLALILLDIKMPQMDGFEVAMRLKKSEQSKNIPIIFLTASSDEESIEKGYRYGGSDYITKPFKIKELLSRVDREIKLHSLIRELEELNSNLETRVQSAVEENRKKEQLLESQSKAAQLGNMIGTIAHQWKQPLNVLSISAGTLLLKQNNNTLRPEDVIKSVNNIKEQITYMSNTISDFKNYFTPSKLNSDFDPIHTLEDTLRLISPRLKHHQISVVIEPHEPICIKGIENELKQVILNLINNAIDALVEKRVENPKIEMQISHNAKYGFVKIADNAGGISPSMLPDKLFESYTSTKGEGGTGIGLHISKNIIEKSFNGSIEAYNKNQGALFKITLPICLG